MEPFIVNRSLTAPAPILLSVPHGGTTFPEELKHEYHPHLITQPDDTDWFVDSLYDFAPSMGITLLAATYSRWVIDVNRDPESKPLYTTTNFAGDKLYRDQRQAVETSEISRRLNRYYKPYHQEIEKQLSELKKHFNKVLIWDCHSIKQYVPTIHAEKFPDLILGDAVGTSASAKLIETAHQSLLKSPYSVAHNYPFQGGYITRHFGKPHVNQHALQLEMSKVQYMDDSERHYDKARATKMKEWLKFTMHALTEELIKA